MHEQHVSVIFIVSQCPAPDMEQRRLAAMARAKNFQRHVSGCLFWTGRYLGHLLEGPSKELGRVVQGMCNDGRQTDPRILFQGQVGLRHFNSSTFAFVPVADFDEAVAEAYDNTTGSMKNRRILLDFLVQEHAEHAFDLEAAESA
jgi:hypothetical protein